MWLVLQVKLKAMLEKNTGFEDLVKVRKTLSGKDSGLPVGMSPDAAQLKYCLLSLQMLRGASLRSELQ